MSVVNRKYSGMGRRRAMLALACAFTWAGCSAAADSSPGRSVPGDEEIIPPCPGGRCHGAGPAAIDT
jgi:hypothetical protein